MLSFENTYILSKNKQFLRWFCEKISSGYDINLDISDLQKIIDYITFWYESRFPERSFSENKEIDFKNIQQLSDILSFEQLMYRFDKDIFTFLQCNYKGDNIIETPYYDDRNNITYIEKNISLTIKSNNPERHKDLLIVYDALSGLIKNYEELIEENIIDTKEITIGSLLYILNTKFKNRYDCKELNKIVRNHKYDLQVRKIILMITAYKILTNDDCDKNIRLLRYRTFIDEFNSKLFDLKISSDTNIMEDIKVFFKK